jgi:hypothetical protein
MYKIIACASDTLEPPAKRPRVQPSLEDIRKRLSLLVVDEKDIKICLEIGSEKALDEATRATRRIYCPDTKNSLFESIARGYRVIANSRVINALHQEGRSVQPKDLEVLAKAIYIRDILLGNPMNVDLFEEDIKICLEIGTETALDVAFQLAESMNLSKTRIIKACLEIETKRTFAIAAIATSRWADETYDIWMRKVQAYLERGKEDASAIDSAAIIARKIPEPYFLGRSWVGSGYDPPVQYVGVKDKALLAVLTAYLGQGNLDGAIGLVKDFTAEDRYREAIKLIKKIPGGARLLAKEVPEIWLRDIRRGNNILMVNKPRLGDFLRECALVHFPR